MNSMFTVEFVDASGLPGLKEFDSRNQATEFADSLAHHARVLHRCTIGNESWELPLHGYR